MNIVVVGLNHKSAPIEVRERLAFSEKVIENTFIEMGKLSSIKEKVILSTCNRVEIYATAEDATKGIEELKRFMAYENDLSLEEIERYLYSFYADAAISHLFRVSSSLDSMVVGEPQILGQVKDAYFLAKIYKATGTILNQLFERAFSVAKRIRTETGISQHAVSISFAAVELAKKIFDSLEGKSVLLIGAGEMAELAARHLVCSGVKTILVSNRTFDRAVELAVELKGNAIRFENMVDELIRTDIVICSTAAPHFIIKKKMIEEIIHYRKNRPMFLIDIAVPRNIEPSVNEIDNVYLYDIDDLKNVIDYNIKEREREAKKAEELITREIDLFNNWLRQLYITPTISALREKAEAIRVKEMEKTFSKWKDITDEERIAIDNLTSAIIKKILHDPTISLKDYSSEKDAHWYVKMVRHLFRLD